MNKKKSRKRTVRGTISTTLFITIWNLICVMLHSRAIIITRVIVWHSVCSVWDRLKTTTAHIRWHIRRKFKLPFVEIRPMSFLIQRPSFNFVQYQCVDKSEWHTDAQLLITNIVLLVRATKIESFNLEFACRANDIDFQRKKKLFIFWENIRPRDFGRFAYNLLSQNTQPKRHKVSNFFICCDMAHTVVSNSQFITMTLWIYAVRHFIFHSIRWKYWTELMRFLLRDNILRLYSLGVNYIIKFILLIVNIDGDVDSVQFNGNAIGGFWKNYKCSFERRMANAERQTKWHFLCVCVSLWHIFM